MTWITIASLLLVVAGTAIISQIIKPADEPWHKPIRDWMMACVSYVGRVFGWFGRIAGWIVNTPDADARNRQHQLWQSEDANFSRRLESSLAHHREEVSQQWQAVLTARREQIQAERGRVWGNMLGFLIAIVGLPPLLAGSYIQKRQVVNEFLGAVKLLKGLELPLFGGVYSLKMTAVVSGALVGMELITGVILSIALERQRQIERGEIHDTARQYRVLFWGSIVFTGALILLEGYLGIFRSHMQEATSVDQIVWNVVYSTALPIATVAVAYFLKSNLKHVTGPAGFVFRLLFAIIGFVLLMPVLLATLVCSVLVGIVLVLAYLGLSVFNRRPPPDALSLLLVAGLLPSLMTSLMLNGCERVDNAKVYLPPEQLTIERVEVMPAQQTYVLLDISASNTFLTDVFKEVTALVTQTPPLHQICLVPISADSRASSSAPWCRGLLDPLTCVMPAIREDDFDGMAEIRAYRAATERLQSELATCEADRETRRTTQAARAGEPLRRWLTSLKHTQYTDISGALTKAIGMDRNGISTNVWIYSDMIEDLPKGVTASVPDLLGVTVHVRLLSKAGAGYQATAREREWRARLTEYKAGEVEWKDFYVGEFATTQ